MHSSQTSSLEKGMTEAGYMLKRFSDVLAVLFAFVVGTLRPSLLNSVYFVVSLVLITWWSTKKPVYRCALYGLACTNLLLQSSLQSHQAVPHRLHDHPPDGSLHLPVAVDQVRDRARRPRGEDDQADEPGARVGVQHA